ncbi:hypothetical protein Athai_25020 [Actinocatenispora thailandica]|uniref:phospholipase D n=1 Tax=Actinocatenispora thailandica TaxID=227318 RepID=A0A7R7HXE7_9ACTN|nr:phospholipase D-like domain-containing protein [Actinocatenispora thailandica]BCJ34999.1 hypothetical protein Athai_25020 [Actinocatenispora thailandica]
MRPRLRSLFTVPLLAATLLVGTAAPATGQPAATGFVPTTGAVFNDPLGTAAQQNAIKDRIIATIDATRPGATIRSSMYALTDQDYTDALVTAHDRGVTVRVVLDAKYAGSAASQNLIAALGSYPSAGSWVRVCMAGGACIAHGGVNPINHNKFFTFSSVGRVRYVVIQASANQTALNVQKYFNNAYTVVHNRPLYDAYDRYFADLAAMVPDNDYFTTGRTGAERYWFLPEETGDVAVDILDRVRCTGNHRRGTPGDHRSIVRVSAFALHRAAVADALTGLADAGCRVEVVYTNSNQVDNLSGHPNLALRRLKDADGYLVHSKYFLIEGNYAGRPDRTLTFAGSANLDFSSLRENDETILEIDGAAAHDAYRGNFDRLWQVATPAG